jgi:hypothetical protein
MGGWFAQGSKHCVTHRQFEFRRSLHRIKPLENPTNVFARDCRKSFEQTGERYCGLTSEGPSTFAIGGGFHLPVSASDFGA